MLAVDGHPQWTMSIWAAAQWQVLFPATTSELGPAARYMLLMLLHCLPAPSVLTFAPHSGEVIRPGDVTPAR